MKKILTMHETQKRFPSLDVIFELAKEKLHFQSEQWNAIDSKNAIVLAVYGIVLAIFLNVDARCFSVCQKHAFLVWLAITTLGMACSIISIRPRDIDIPPKISKLSEKYLEKDEYDTKNSLLSTIEESIEKNDKIINRKTRYLSISVNFCLPVSLGVSVISVLFKIILGDE